jgi:hypothetical protein
MIGERMMDESLRSLQEWYASQCDGDWEHGHGVEITTLDNPGWLVKINLIGTELEARIFEPVTEPEEATAFEASDRWLHCEVKAGRWQGAGDETKLAVIVRTFLDWAANANEVGEY